jgi:phosphonate degradation associated HDIG domain protein
MQKHLDQTLAIDLAQTDADQKTDVLFAYMEKRGQSFYDEAVTQLEHALQCANQARLDGSDAESIASALLHDLGHFLLEEHEADGSFLDTDLNHEEIGADYLEPFFPAAVTEPVRLHVPAKRYLCTTDASYYEALSRASKRSFKLQGGAMSAAEVAAFEENPHLAVALKLRRWDDKAKVNDLQTPGLASYRSAVQSCFK